MADVFLKLYIEDFYRNKENIFSEIKSLILILILYSTRIYVKCLICRMKGLQKKLKLLKDLQTFLHLDFQTFRLTDKVIYRGVSLLKL